MKGPSASAESDWLSVSGHDFLSAVAARQPTPGGGSVAAAAGALATAMARMVAAYSPAREAGDGARTAVSTGAAELEQADGMLRRLVNEDAAAYQAYTDARKSSDTAAQERAAAVAVAVPMEIAAVACAVLGVLERLKDVLNRNLNSDLGVAAVLADACVRAAAFSVRINLKQTPSADPSGETRREIDALCDHAAALSRSLTTFVERQL